MVEQSEIRILVIDDESFMLKLLGHMLSKLGFTLVSSCNSGHGALEWLAHQNSPPDIILLDINMPKMDGIEFVRHLVEGRYSSHLILVSGEDERMQQSVEKLVQAQGIPILGHLHKPVNPIDLSAMLGKWTPSCRVVPQGANKVYYANEVRAAILGGELVNYYQPKVDLISGKVVGIESLVRWNHPQDGVVLPDHFIGLAEEHGMIDDLTRTVIGHAFLQTKSWQDAGLHLRVAVNISMDNLYSLQFADYVTTAAFSVGIVPEDIVLEVTESRLVKNIAASLETLTRLRMKHFSLSIDDFGTGHSSFTQLRNIPFDELKVDRSFVDGAASDEMLRTFYYASLNLAKQLGMKTVAEGVGNRADWDFVRSTGCDMAQGFFIAKPMPPGEIPDWISAWEASFENLMESPAMR